MNFEEQIQRIEDMRFLAFPGEINLKTPDETFIYYEDYSGLELDAKRTSNPPPRQVFFGVFVATGNRHTISKYDLKKRSYLGTTSMDAELSLVMANMAKARPGSLVLDPFVGTGSFLVSCSHFGAMTMGSDIDGRQIRGVNGKGVDNNIAQYKLQDLVIGTVVCDIAHHPWRVQPLFDAIVCDVS